MINNLRHIKSKWATLLATSPHLSLIKIAVNLAVNHSSSTSFMITHPRFRPKADNNLRNMPCWYGMVSKLRLDSKNRKWGLCRLCGWWSTRKSSHKLLTFNVVKWTILNFNKTALIPVNVLRVQSTKFQMQPVAASIVQPWKSWKIMYVPHVHSISMSKLGQMVPESAMTVM